jgi:hypothetical protein
MEETSWVKQQLQLLLSAYGYNLYNSVNRARADDLLVRERAGEWLSQAVDLLTRLGTDYHARFVPPSTREQPFPPADKLAALKEIQALRDDISRLGSRIRGMSVPTADQTWAKYRDEHEMLSKLLLDDYHLIAQAESVWQSVQALTAEEWGGAHGAEIRIRLQDVEQTARDRARLLQGN